MYRPIRARFREVFFPAEGDYVGTTLVMLGNSGQEEQSKIQAFVLQLGALG